MSLDNVIKELDLNSEVLDSFVLVSEIKLYLNLNSEVYKPEVRIKTFKSSSNPEQEYSCDVSHHAHTPLQGSPYFNSNSASTENGAIALAIFNTSSYLNMAIDAGHDPENNWLVVNEDF